MRKIRKAKCYSENTELMGDDERGMGVLIWAGMAR